MNDQQLEWAVKQVRNCRRISIPYFEKSHLQVRRKADNSPVTAADVEVETKLRYALAKAFPDDCIVGEELSKPERRGDSYWTVDPIDGTRAFTRGLPFWGTLLGRVDKNRAVLGVCDFPALDITLYGSLRAGAYIREGRRVNALDPVKPHGKLKDAVILHGGSCWWKHTRYAMGFDRVAAECFLERAYGDCYGYLWLFRGLADAVIERGLELWDIVPMAAIARCVGLNVYGPEGSQAFDGDFAVMSGARLGKELACTLSARR